MRTYLHHIIYVVLLVIGSSTLQAQDAHFSQFYAAPLYLNPAFAGNTTQARMGINYRSQWASLPSAYTTYQGFFDYNLESMNSGIGILFSGDKAGSFGLNTSSVYGLYSYTIQMNRKVALKLGVSAGYTNRSLDYSSLVFGDQLTKGSGALTVEENIARNSHYADINAGGLIYSRQFWLGAAVNHINRPNQSLLGSESPLPIKFSVHGGVNFTVIKDIKKRQVAVLTLLANYKHQDFFDQADFGVYYRFKIFTMGAWYRGIPMKQNAATSINQDALVLVVGYTHKGLSFGYSYDITVSRLIGSTGGAHEISLVYEVASKAATRRKNRNRYMVPCAKF